MRPYTERSNVESKWESLHNYKRILLWTSFFSDPSFRLRNVFFKHYWGSSKHWIRYLLGEGWNTIEDFSKLGCPEFRCLVKSHRFIHDKEPLTLLKTIFFPGWKIPISPKLMQFCFTRETLIGGSCRDRRTGDLTSSMSTLPWSRLSGLRKVSLRHFSESFK